MKNRVPWNKGLTKETDPRVKKYSDSRVGTKRPDLIERNKSEWMRKIVRTCNLGEKSTSWKGDKVSYFGLHKWIRSRLGTPSECSMCGLNDPKRLYNWANISKKYKRNLLDWIRLCIPCHRKFDDSINKSWKTRKAIA